MKLCVQIEVNNSYPVILTIVLFEISLQGRMAVCIFLETKPLNNNPIRE